MTTHILKTLRSYWIALCDGSKTFEVRRNDRDFAVGDDLVLQCWAPDTDQHGRLEPCSADDVSVFSRGGPIAFLRFVVTYVLPGGDHGIERGYCVLGTRRLGEART